MQVIVLVVQTMVEPNTWTWRDETFYSIDKPEDADAFCKALTFGGYKARVIQRNVWAQEKAMDKPIHSTKIIGRYGITLVIHSPENAD